jgi:hypothetical protein
MCCRSVSPRFIVHIYLNLSPNHRILDLKRTETNSALAVQYMQIIALYSVGRVYLDLPNAAPASPALFTDLRKVRTALHFFS